MDNHVVYLSSSWRATALSCIGRPTTRAEGRNPMTGTELVHRPLAATVFVDHTPDTAPAEARRMLIATTERLGYMPVALGRLAASPHLLQGFLTLMEIFERTTLDPLAREVVVLTMATRNRCRLCVAMHTASLVRLGADPQLVTALRGSGDTLPDARLEALRRFTLDVLASAGGVEDAALRAFLDHGFTPRQALEVVLGIGTYTMSTLANRLIDAPLDEQLASHAWCPATA